MYPTPPGTGMQPVADAVADARQQLRALQRPDGTRLAELYAQVQIALANIVTSVAAAFAALVAGGITTPGNFTSTGGTLISPYARAHSVVTSFVAAYLDGGGNLLSTPSSRRMKRDIQEVHWTPEQWRGIQTVLYTLRAAYILADMRGDDPTKVERLAGVIGEQLLELGLNEFVVLDDRGRVQTVRYELLGLIAIDAAQQLASRVDDLEGEIAELWKRTER